MFTIPTVGVAEAFKIGRGTAERLLRGAAHAQRPSTASKRVV